jgi:hypothetical protein
MYLLPCGRLKFANKKKCVRKSQIRKVSQLRKVDKFVQPAKLRICGTYLRIAYLLK